MTVAVACNLSEGVVLGVDSAVTLPSSDGSGIAKVYEHAEKLFQLGKKPIGIATFGIATFASRGIGSYLRQFEIENRGNLVQGDASLDQVVEALRAFFMDIYAANVIPELEQALGTKFDAIPETQRPAFGLVVGGFSSGAYLSEVWQVLVPNNAVQGSAGCQRRQGDFGTNWFATFEPIRRYIKGYDPALVTQLADYFSTLRGQPFSAEETQQISEILASHEYQIPFPAMPLEEGVAHTRFLVQLAISHHRYAVGAPVVGGRVRIGRVTYRGDEFEILGD